MQLKVNEEGRTHILKYSIVAIIGVTTFFIFYRFDEIKGWFDSLISLLFPLSLVLPSLFCWISRCF